MLKGGTKGVIASDTKRNLGTNDLPPFQGGPVIGNILGLKPQSESFHPFGIILTGLSGTG
jgi:hypothetical protein